MENKTKGDIKATIIMIIYISVGIVSGYFLYQYSETKNGALAVCGFVFGICALALLQAIWELIRLEIED